MTSIKNIVMDKAMKTWTGALKSGLAQRMHRLADRQKGSREEYREACEGLKGIRQKIIHPGDYKILVQLNPARIKSSTAKTDKKSVESRECFLCEKNLPPWQEGLLWEEDYLVLCNPAPVIEKHFTIVYKEHTPQKIAPHFHQLLNLTRVLSGAFTVVYNGAESGASAPDHFHFQAIPSGNLPIEEEVTRGSKLEPLKKNLFFLNEDDRTALILKGRETPELYNQFIDLLKVIQGDPRGEPKINLVSFYKKSEWFVIMFLREKHRPGVYFKTGADRLVISPGSIDMGGILITLTGQDFLNLTPDTMVEIFREVSLPSQRFKALLRQLSEVPS